MPDQERSCWICVHRYPCSMAQAIDNFPPRWLRIGPEAEGGAPLKRLALYDTLAGCCLLFQGRQDA